MKRIVMTGGSDGLGREFAKLCVAEGIEVVCLSRHEPDYPCIHIKTDLADESSIISSVNIIKEKYAKFDAFVNCAGVFSTQDIDKIDFDNLENVMRVNVIAPIFLTSQLFDLIKSNEADILNVGSTAGKKGNAKECVYGASKWSVQGFSQSMQAELKETRSRVIIFNPGGMNTKFFEKFLKKEKDVSSFMNPKDVAEVMLYTLKMPKQLEVSEILINRKAVK